MRKEIVTNFRKHILSLTKCTPIKEKSIIMKVISILYNFFISLLGYVIIIPIIYVIFVNPTIKEAFWGPYWLIFFVIVCILLFDYLIYCSVMDIQYNEKKIKTFSKKIFFSHTRNYQALSSIVLITLFIIYTDFSNNGIYLKNNDNKIILEVSFFLLMLPNCLLFINRFLFWNFNEQKIYLIRTIIKRRKKSILIVALIVIPTLIIFSFVILLSQEDATISPDTKTIVTYWDSLWYCFVTVTTIGYGDFVVQGSLGKILTVPLAIIGISLYGFLASLTISFFSEYNESKSKLRTQAKNAKTKQKELDYLLKQMNKVILTNLYNAKVISETNYKKMMHKDIELDQEIEYSKVFENLEFDYKKSIISYDGEQLGKLDTIENQEFKENQRPWFAILKKPKNKLKYNILLHIRYQIIQRILKSQKPILFADDAFEPNDFIENIILYHRKPYKNAVLEVEVGGVLSLHKNDAWDKFGHYSYYTKQEFDRKFKNKEKVSVILIKNKTIYTNPKFLESFGIYSSGKIKDIIYLI